MTDIHWDTLDWKTLDRLREAFLSDTPPRASYWTQPADLAHYDFTFGQRIAWKWDAVLAELQHRGWRPPGRDILDWGCGSGIAGRRVAEWMGPKTLGTLRVHDRSPLAARYAVAAAASSFPRARVEPVGAAWLDGEAPVGVLVVSHVLNELSPGDLRDLLRLTRRADAVLWVEPGTHPVSRALGEVRERLLSGFTVVAPCTHQAACGMFAPGNERHWCHSFAEPPAGIMADPNWVRFARRAGIDLRRLPYSFLVLERSGAPCAANPPRPEGWSRIVGQPRRYKGFSRILCCRPEGVAELTLQHRDDPVLARAIDKNAGLLLYRWRMEGDRIRGGEAWASAGAPSPQP